MTTIQRRGTCLVLSLPPELVHMILDCLPKVNILHMTWVSRRLRAISARHERYFIPLKVKLLTWDQDYGYLDLSKMDEAVNHAVGRELRLGLDLHLYTNQEHAPDPWFSPLSTILRRALPILARIEITTDATRVGHVLLDALRFPAPLLRSFSFKGREKYTLPVDLFLGFAPRLFRVNLNNITLGNTPIPAFHNVRIVSSSDVGGNLFSIFPHLQYLGCELSQRAYLDILEFWSLSLLHLDIGYDTVGLCSKIEQQLALSNISTIVFGIFDYRHDDMWDGEYGRFKPIWKGISGQVAICMDVEPWSKEDVMLISVRELDQPQRCRAYVQERKDLVEHLVLFDPIWHLLPVTVDIHIASSLVVELIRSVTDLPTLQRLRVDYAQPWAYTRRSKRARSTSLPRDEQRNEQLVMSCPRLEVVELHAISQSCSVESFEVTQMGLGLGQLLREPTDRARLELFGVHIHPISTNNSVTVFSDVMHHDYSQVPKMMKTIHCYTM